MYESSTLTLGILCGMWINLTGEGRGPQIGNLRYFCIVIKNIVVLILHLNANQHLKALINRSLYLVQLLL